MSDTVTRILFYCQLERVGLLLQLPLLLLLLLAFGGRVNKYSWKPSDQLYFFSPYFREEEKLRKGKISTNFPDRVLGNSLTERCHYFTSTNKRKKTSRNDELRSTTITIGNLILMWPSEIDLGRPRLISGTMSDTRTDGCLDIPTQEVEVTAI